MRQFSRLTSQFFYAQSLSILRIFSVFSIATQFQNFTNIHKSRTCFFIRLKTRFDVKKLNQLGKLSKKIKNLVFHLIPEPKNWLQFWKFKFTSQFTSERKIGHFTEKIHDWKICHWIGVFSWTIKILENVIVGHVGKMRNSAWNIRSKVCHDAIIFQL